MSIRKHVYSVEYFGNLNETDWKVDQEIQRDKEGISW